MSAGKYKVRGLTVAKDAHVLPNVRINSALVRNARRQAWRGIRELKHIDRHLTTLGCLNAHVHFKRRIDRHGRPVRSRMMYLLAPRDHTGKRRYTYIGVDPERQDDALAQIERFEVRQRLRRRIVQLKQMCRAAEHELATALAIYGGLIVQVRDCTREFAAYTPLPERDRIKVNRG